MIHVNRLIRAAESVDRCCKFSDILDGFDHPETLEFVSEGKPFDPYKEELCSEWWVEGGPGMNRWITVYLRDREGIRHLIFEGKPPAVEDFFRGVLVGVKAAQAKQED